MTSNAHTCPCNHCKGRKMYASRRTLTRHKTIYGISDNIMIDTEGYQHFLAQNPELTDEGNSHNDRIDNDEMENSEEGDKDRMDSEDDSDMHSDTLQAPEKNIHANRRHDMIDPDSDDMYVDSEEPNNGPGLDLNDQVHSRAQDVHTPPIHGPEQDRDIHTPPSVPRHLSQPPRVPVVPPINNDNTDEFADELDEDLRNAAQEHIARDLDDNNDPDEHDDHEYHPSVIENVSLAQAYIQEVSRATLENGALDADIIMSLRIPEEPSNELLEDPITRLSIDLYLSCASASLATYNNVRDAYLRNIPHSAPLSLHRVQKVISMASGIVDFRDDMCINGCHAFTGPLALLDHCKDCHEHRYHQGILERTGKHVARKQATTLLLGPQLQALRRSPTASQAMRYQHKKTQSVFDAINSDVVNLTYDDIFSGYDYLELAEKLSLTEDDTSVLFSLDGAQLYRNKKSDTWIAIWIVANYDPQTRYKKISVLPALVIPGPNKPKNIDSFTFRGFHHLSALQREVNNGVPGIRVWDAMKKSIISSRVIFLLGTADAVALTELDGRVGHHGAQGCRIGCTMVGRHKPGTGHYHAAHLRPCVNGELYGHPDFQFRSENAYRRPTPEQYEVNINLLSNSRSQAAYERNRLETGLSKPSILTGLKREFMLQVPDCFSVDLMHLISLNLGELFIPLWTANTNKIRCQRPDLTTKWDWATLQGDVWEEHGKLVAEATQYFPSSFHRPPRNPHEKINSGYKATEYQHYLFSLGPGFFRAVLPDTYWRHFCKLIRAVHIISKRQITTDEIKEAHRLLVEFVEDYELLYYQRLPTRLHFCRPCIHTLLHLADEILRIGPGCYFTQYTMERSIGEFGKGIRQPSNPFANLCQVTVRYAQNNAMKALYPDLNPMTSPTPKAMFLLESGYALCQPRDRTLHTLSLDERHAIDIALIPATSRVQRWGRLKLPNGQIARSRRSEDNRKAENIRVSRNVKIQRSNGAAVEFGEVQFYFLSSLNNQNNDSDLEESESEQNSQKRVAYALVSLYGMPDARLLEASCQTLWASKYLGMESLDVVPVTSILSVVSMQPLPKKHTDTQDLWFVAEKLGLNDIDMVDNNDDNDS